MTVEEALLCEIAYCYEMITHWWNCIASYNRTGNYRASRVAYFYYSLWIAQEQTTRKILDSLLPNLALGA